MKILFCGDFVFSGNTIFTVSSELKSYFSKHDFRILNYEAPIKDVNTNIKPLIKVGPHVCNSSKGLNLLKELEIDATALANNHIMDYGTEALLKTKELLLENGFKTVGAGTDFEEVYKPFILEQNGERVAIFNLCQAEFGVMKTSGIKAGYAWINHNSVNSRIKKYVDEGFVVIVFAHAGVEDEEYVLPEWRQRYHEFIELGAKYVIATHPHIFQGIENYKEGIIVYSLGNFLFDGFTPNSNWCRGLIAAIDTKNLEAFTVRVLSFENNKLEFCETRETESLLNKRKSYVQNDQVVEELANKLAQNTFERYYKSYYENLVPHTFKQLLKFKIKKILGKNPMFLDQTMLLHNLQIESHRYCVERYLYNCNIKQNFLLKGKLFDDD